MKQRGIFFTILILLILLPVLWDTTRSETQYISLGIVLIVGAIWIVIRSRNRIPMSVPKFILPLALLILFRSVLLIFITPLPAYGLYWILSDILIVIFYLFLVDSIKNGWPARIWENGFISIAIVLTGIELLFIIFWYIAWWKTTSSFPTLPPFSIRAPGGVLGHPNMTAGYINMIFPIVLVRYLQSSRNDRRTLYILVLLLLLVVEFFTSSRGGWLALSLSVLLIIFLFYLPKLSYINRKRQFDSRIPIKRNKKTLAGAIILIFALLITPLLVRQVRLAMHGRVSDRIDIWLYGLNLIADSPIAGHGPGAIPFLYALRSYAIGGDEFYHTHNLWLQITAENGFLGLILLLITLGLILRAFLSAWQDSEPDTPKRNYIIAFAGIGIGLMVHGLLDYLLLKIIFTMGVFLLLGLFYQFVSDREYFKVQNKYTILIIVSLLIIFTSGTLYNLRGSHSYWEGLQAAGEKNWIAAREKLCEASVANPAASYYLFQCSFANAMIAQTKDDPVALGTAIDYQRAGLYDDPYWYLHWANLASYEWYTDDRNQALVHMQLAAEAAPRLSYLWLNLGWMEEQSGDNKAAVEHYRFALCLNPWYQDSLLFEQSLVFQESLQSDCPEEFYRYGIDPAHDFLWQGWLAYRNNDLVEAEYNINQSLLAQPQNGTAYALLALIYQANGLDENAWSSAQTALFLNQRSVRTLLIADQISKEQDRETQAIHFISQAFDIVTTPFASVHYYPQSYRQLNLPTDVSPFLQVAVSPDVRDAFLDLADYERQQGNLARSEEILSWLERTIPDTQSKIHSLQRNLE